MLLEIFMNLPILEKNDSYEKSRNSPNKYTSAYFNESDDDDWNNSNDDHRPQRKPRENAHQSTI